MKLVFSAALLGTNAASVFGVAWQHSSVRDLSPGVGDASAGKVEAQVWRASPSRKTVRLQGMR